MHVCQSVADFQHSVVSTLLLDGFCFFWDFWGCGSLKIRLTRSNLKRRSLSHWSQKWCLSESEQIWASICRFCQIDAPKSWKIMKAFRLGSGPNKVGVSRGSKHDLHPVRPGDGADTHGILKKDSKTSTMTRKKCRVDVIVISMLVIRSYHSRQVLWCLSKQKPKQRERGERGRVHERVRAWERF